jgi:hypothetical protein
MFWYYPRIVLKRRLCNADVLIFKFWSGTHILFTSTDPIGNDDSGSSLRFPSVISKMLGRGEKVRFSLYIQWKVCRVVEVYLYHLLMLALDGGES